MIEPGLRPHEETRLCGQKEQRLLRVGAMPGNPRKRASDLNSRRKAEV